MLLLFYFIGAPFNEKISIRNLDYGDGGDTMLWGDNL